MQQYKFLCWHENSLRSHMNFDNKRACIWTLGEWKEERDIELRNRGFHCSPHPMIAMINAIGVILADDVFAEVEVEGDSQKTWGMSCWERMRVTRAWHWTQQDSARLALYGAEKALPVYQQIFPGDDRLATALAACAAATEHEGAILPIPNIEELLDGIKQVQVKALHDGFLGASRAAEACVYALKTFMQLTPHFERRTAFIASRALYNASLAYGTYAEKTLLIQDFDAWILNRIALLTEIH